MFSKVINGKVEIENPTEKVGYLWKYFDLHRFIYLITERKLYFTRLDKLEDPFEGVSTEFLRTEALAKEFWKDIGSKNDKEIEEIYVQQKVVDYIKGTNKHIKNQVRQYTNCWFLCERESMAMWNLYSNEDSVAVKIDFQIAKNQFTEAFQELVAENGNRIEVVGGQVKYLNLNPFDLKTEKQNLEYSAMKKDTSYSHEKEYRFLIYTNPLDNQPFSFEVPINIDKLQLTIVTHPRMSNWKFKNLENLIKLSKVKVDLVKSSTIIKI